MRTLWAQPGLTLFELIPAIACIPVGITVGQYVHLRSDSVVLAVVLGVVSIPVAFFVIAYGFMIAIMLPLIIGDKLFGRTSPRDEYFDDPP